jgi:Uncharacterized conserved protein (COG2071)
MRAPALAAVMERRILVNYRVDPDLLGSYLPAPFRPALVGGHGVAGICLIRLGRIRPAGLPAAGLRSENAAHRVAVCWDGPDGPVTGVYIPRRDTSSRLAALAGGRLFPGYLHLARFRAHEDGGVTGFRSPAATARCISRPTPIAPGSFRPDRSSPASAPRPVSSAALRPATPPRPRAYSTGWNSKQPAGRWSRCAWTGSPRASSTTAAASPQARPSRTARS